MTCAALVLVTTPADVSATPSDELSRAVPAAEDGQQFVFGFTSVVARANVRALPDYVTAAIQLKPALTTKIVTVAVQSAVRGTRSNEQLLRTVVGRTIVAAIRANPDAAVAVAKAAVETAPTLHDSIVASAIAAAPEQKDEIERATSRGSLLAGLFRRMGSEGMFGSGMGSLNPANVSDTRDAVVSPEQPPLNR